ncbi:MAG: Lrp/AsnC family transcriptional regulator [Bacteroidota bacterium]|nr:Lrp/AsnC family transcriptional regulator [Bacteroidota bacterium]
MLDATDIAILKALQENGRIRRKDIAAATGLSQPAVNGRLKKLEDKGYILGYTVLLNPTGFGKNVTAFISVCLDTRKHGEDFFRRVDSQGDILECHAVTGESTHLLKVRTDSLRTLEALIGVIGAWPGVKSLCTSVVLATRKETLSFPIEEHVMQGGG